ncbi:MAG: head-tail connector protein [Cellulosilyticaceae bacterium]
MKLSEITLPIVKEYLRQDGDEDDRLIEAIINGSKAYVANYTGQTIEELENQEDVAISVLVLVAEFYDSVTCC